MDNTAIVVAIIAGCVSIASAIINIIGNRLAKKQEHTYKEQDEKTEWQKSVDVKLAIDKDRIDMLTKDLAKLMEDMSKQSITDTFLLEGIFLLTQHVVTNNHTEDIIKYSDKIRRYLFKTEE